MSLPIVVRGRYAGHAFIPDEPLPDTEGAAQLVITPAAQSGGSIFDLFGQAPQLRTGDDIAAQLDDERSAWDEP